MYDILNAIKAMSLTPRIEPDVADKLRIRSCILGPSRSSKTVLLRNIYVCLPFLKLIKHGYQ